MHIKEDVGIEGASAKLSEAQRQTVSLESDLDARAPFSWVLDFLEHALLSVASGVGSGKAVLVAACRLLGATGDVMVILETLRSLVATADIRGTGQQKSDAALDMSGVEDIALMATAPYNRGDGSGLRLGGLLGSCRSAPKCGVGTSSYVRPPEDVGCGQHLLRPKEVIHNAGGGGVQSHSAFGADSGRRSLLHFIYRAFSATAVALCAVPPTDSKGGTGGAIGGGATSVGHGGTAARADGHRDEEAQVAASEDWGGSDLGGTGFG